MIIFWVKLVLLWKYQNKSKELKCGHNHSFPIFISIENVYTVHTINIKRF